MVGEFVYFLKHPVELRLRTWTEALQGPRILELFYEPGHDDITHELRDEALRANISPPVLLHVCSESREVALNKYIALGTPDINRLTIINPNKDTVYFPFSEITED
jgi:hypothetical protein